MRDINMILKLSIPAVAIGLLVAACTKTEETPPPTPPPAPTQSEAAKPPPASEAPISKPAGMTAPQAPAATAMPAAAMPPGSAAQVAATIENAYIANPDFNSRVEQIYKLTDAATPEAIASLGRLFQMEKDPDLKTEILDSMFDIDGQDERKAALFAAGAGADQPKDVRQSAIDGLEDIDPKYALPILQALTSDPDEDIRDAAKDAVESLQDQPVQPAKPAQSK